MLNKVLAMIKTIIIATACNFLGGGVTIGTVLILVALVYFDMTRMELDLYDKLKKRGYDD